MPLIFLCILLFLSPAGQNHASAAEPPWLCAKRTLPDDVEPIEFADARVVIGSAAGDHTLRVETAESGEQQARGLMYVSVLAEDCGMLFVHASPQEGVFWMFNTLIPLSIAFADDSGVIFQIGDMLPCTNLSEDECDRQSYPALGPFRFALEVNRGYFDRRDIRIGDRIVIVPGHVE